MDMHAIALVRPMVVGTVAVICTILIHAVPLNAAMRLVSHENTSAHRRATSS